MAWGDFGVRWCLALLMVVAVMSFGNGAGRAWAQGNGQEKRVALVIGNSAYKNTAALANPRNDAHDMARALEGTGFEVIVALDATKAQMDGALRAFADKLSGADVALFFYAGHGLQVGSQNYLVPTEARLARERDLAFEAVSLEFILRQMEIDRESKTTIVMLDACRDNPLTRNLARSMGTRSTAIGQGLAAASTGVGTFIAYSTQPGNVALDGKGRNSPFTAALLGNISASGRNINTTMIEVRKAVIKATGGQQVPWDHSALTGDFYFVPGAPRTGSTVVAPAGKRDDVEALKARLKALEDAEAKRLAAATPGRAPAAGGGETLDRERIIEVAEKKARLAVASDKARDLQRKLLEARRVEGQAKDPAERQRLVRQSMAIMLEMTQASQQAKTLRAEIEALEASPAPGGSDLDLKPTRSERGFEIYTNAGLSGSKIKFASADSIAGCINVCRNTPNCVAGEYLANAGRQSACNVYSHVQRLRSGAPGASAFIKPSRQGALPPVQPRGEPGGDVAFERADNVRIEGDALKPAFRAANPDACAKACGAEASCIAYQHGRKIPVMGQCQLFSSIVSRHEDKAWRSGVRTDGATLAKAPADGGGGKCQPMSIAFSEPIALHEGLKLCNGIGMHAAFVERIGDYGVSFSVPEGKDFTCGSGNVCQFNWPGSPSPRFRVEITKSNAIAPATARMVPGQ